MLGVSERSPLQLFDRTPASFVELGNDCLWICVDYLWCLRCIRCLCDPSPAFIMSGRSRAKLSV